VTTHMTPPRLLSVVELAEYLNRQPRWVSSNAARLGGFKVGALWRFDLEQVRARLDAHRTADPLAPTPMSAARQARKRTAA